MTIHTLDCNKADSISMYCLC